MPSDEENISQIYYQILHESTGQPGYNVTLAKAYIIILEQLVKALAPIIDAQNETDTIIPSDMTADAHYVLKNIDDMPPESVIRNLHLVLDQLVSKIDKYVTVYNKPELQHLVAKAERLIFRPDPTRITSPLLNKNPSSNSLANRPVDLGDTLSSDDILDLYKKAQAETDPVKKEQMMKQVRAASSEL